MTWLLNAQWSLLLTSSAMLVVAGACALLATRHNIAGIRAQARDPMTGTREPPASAELHKEARRRWQQRCLAAFLVSITLACAALVVSVAA